MTGIANFKGKKANPFGKGGKRVAAKRGAAKAVLASAPSAGQKKLPPALQAAIARKAAAKAGK